MALNEDKRAMAVMLYDKRQHTIAQIYRMMGISKPTLYKYIGVAKRSARE